MGENNGDYVILSMEMRIGTGRYRVDGSLPIKTFSKDGEAKPLIVIDAETEDVFIKKEPLPGDTGIKIINADEDDMSEDERDELTELVENSIKQAKKDWNQGAAFVGDVFNSLDPVQ